MLGRFKAISDRLLCKVNTCFRNSDFDACLHCSFRIKVYDLLLTDRHYFYVPDFGVVKHENYNLVEIVLSYKWY